MADKNNVDPAFLLVDTVDFILGMTKVIYDIVQAGFELSDADFDKGMFTLITLTIDNGIIEIATTMLGGAMLLKKVALSDSKLILGSDGHVLMTGESITTSVAVANTKDIGPTSAVLTAVKYTKLGLAITELVDIVKDFSIGIAKPAIEFHKDEPEYL
jgi:hypothetical protein